MRPALFSKGLTPDGICVKFGVMLQDNQPPDENEERAALRDLITVATRLDPVQVELLTEIARTMMRQVEETVNPDSDFATPRFTANFRNRLLIHHATNEAKLTKKAFEYAFRGACAADGRAGTITLSDTFSGVDVTVEGVRFSLKTEASKGIRPESITISKFTEARWIQQFSTLDDLAREAVRRIPAHLGQYDRILVLRARDMSATRLLYEVVEIPRDVLGRVAALTAADFSPRTAQGGSSARVAISGRPAFTLRLDGSDGKITIAGLQTEFCVRHISWVIPTVAPAPEAAST